MTKKVLSENDIEKLENEQAVTSGGKYGDLKPSIDLLSWIEKNRRHIPTRELAGRGVISGQPIPGDLFFLFKNSFQSFKSPMFRASKDEIGAEESLQRALVLSWMSLIGFRAKTLDLPPFSADSLTKDYLSSLVKLSVDPNNLTEIPEILRSIGIGFVVEKAIDRAKVDGAVYVNENGNPIIGMSLRYDRLDNFWFTLLHELSHLVLHLDRLSDPIIDDLHDDQPLSEIEKEANYYARETILPKKIWRRCRLKSSHKVDAVEELAQSLEIHPALVIGRFHHETNRHDLFRDILHSVSVRDYFFGER